jgi:hypothetical protein
MNLQPRYTGAPGCVGGVEPGCSHAIAASRSYTGTHATCSASAGAPRLVKRAAGELGNDTQLALGASIIGHADSV